MRGIFLTASGEDREVPTHRAVKAVVQRLADQGVTDRYFGELRDRALEYAEIFLIEIMAGVHVQPGFQRSPRGINAPLQLGDEVAIGECMRIRAGVKLDPRNAERACFLERSEEHTSELQS